MCKRFIVSNTQLLIQKNVSRVSYLLHQGLVVRAAVSRGIKRSTDYYDKIELVFEERGAVGYSVVNGICTLLLCKRAIELLVPISMP